jgi:hypothetical protein
MGQLPDLHRFVLSWILLGKAALGVAAWAFVGSAAVAASAGLCGLLFGMLHALVHLEPLAYFSFCGALAGGLLGGFARLLDPVGVADLAYNLRQRVRSRGCLAQRGDPAWPESRAGGPEHSRFPPPS